jgi:hypothetical protein
MLETEIKNLVAAIQLLTDAVNKNHLSPQIEAPAEQLVVEAEAPKVEQDTLNVDSLQQRCLEITRIDRANSAKIKDIITEYGVNLLKDIPADKLGEFSVKLEQLVQ